MSLRTVLSNYKECARYLTKCVIITKQHSPMIILGARGEFKVDSPCHIKSTGHVNLVDLQICFNQLGLVAFYESLSSFTSSTMLKSTLLREMNMKMTRKVSLKEFYGEMTLTEVKTPNSVLNQSFRGEMRFFTFDSDKSFANGFAQIAISK